MDANDTWTYHDKDGISVSYPGGYPDFSSHVSKSAAFEFEGNHTSDYSKAYATPPPSEPDKNFTWHDLQLMQLIPKDIHDRFTHRGGVSLLREKRKAAELV